MAENTTNAINRVIGANVRLLRFKAGLTPAAASARAHVDSAKWEAWEAGEVRIGARELYDIIAILDADISEIYAGILPDDSDRPD